jgi:hypothetical protein
MTLRVCCTGPIVTNTEVGKLVVLLEFPSVVVVFATGSWAINPAEPYRLEIR